MDREQAAVIHRHLLAAATAIGRAQMLTFGLGPEDRAAFSEPLGNVVTTLNFDLLQVMIYRRFPDLRPKEKARINSKLTWDKVRLPPSVTALDFDRVILSTISPQWRKRQDRRHDV